MPEPKPAPRDVANVIADGTDTDVLLLNGPMNRPFDNAVITGCRARRRRKNVLVLVVTSGGSPDAAYRIARCLQELYERFTAYVPGYCKSAGTLLVLGAHDVVIGDGGELGPLDVQMNRRDELFERQSGLTATSALTTLNEKAYLAFEHFLLQTKIRGGSSLTTRTATDIATRLTIGLFAPIYQQIDPLHVGEAGRAMLIAQKYGQILHQKGQNFDLAALDDLISGYPSHGFVIDRRQAEQFFTNVREPEPLESLLAQLLGERARWPSASNDDASGFVSDELPATSGAAAGPNTGDRTDAGPQATAGSEQAAAAGGGGVAPVVSAEHTNVTPFGEHRRSGEAAQQG
jgi:hypothetical protein